MGIQGNERETGTVELVRRRDRGTVEKLFRNSVEPWEEDRGAGKAWEPDWNTQGERLRESTGKEKINK